MLADIDITDVLEDTETDISRALSVLNILSEHMFKYYEDNVGITEYTKAIDLVVGVLADNRKRLNGAIKNTTILHAKFIPD